jgi:hypothetical protein
MELLPQEIRETLPELCSQEKQGWGAIAHVKFFTPDSHWTWWASEYDPDTRTFFGLVQGFERELGYFSLDDLEQITGPLGLRVERDLYWTPRPVSPETGCWMPSRERAPPPSPPSVKGGMLVPWKPTG